MSSLLGSVSLCGSRVLLLRRLPRLQITNSLLSRREVAVFYRFRHRRPNRIQIDIGRTRQNRRFIQKSHRTITRLPEFPDLAIIEDLLTIAVSLDDPSSVNAALYDETNWSNPERIASILADGLETVSPGALRVALEIMLSADLDSEPISSVCARRADDFWVNYRWGKALAAKGRAEAMRFCQAAVAIRPDDHGARVVLGTLLVNRGDLQAAIRCRDAVHLFSIKEIGNVNRMALLHRGFSKRFRQCAFHGQQWLKFFHSITWYRD